ncbi:SDR family oxidoreductase [Aidingimonas halophila]|uniref:NADP-dependent 3-hydroxy acid dehydrogenase YdfG n=1 Tax=Aidingimonas halophila TaxID=574349 RepID=A0A1H3CKL7_9GAMM|nr:SDR family oxidoreductase [Aidingimonas halophila]GHC35315.1 oxidoreductase [Aidingimonas halophila]SDX54677.1 NADP-dependent 3-hydroxy acid dehydrogenase YdfG [Aidingimonas halophila]
MRDKVAVVTGAGSGIGRVASLALVGDGYRVALLGRRRDRLEETASLAGDADTTLVVVADVGDEASVDAAFDRVLASWGRVDLLFNNAGRGAPPATPDELPVAVWREVVDTNLTGSFLCARAAFRVMREQSPRGGRIINNGSISAYVPRPLSVAYTATKHAITGLTRSLSLDGRAYDIACGQIDIGNADTEMTARMAEGILQPNGDVVPEPRMNAEEVGRAIVHMASLPLAANVQFMTVMATGMPYVGRG